jgi:hypothetical protein
MHELFLLPVFCLVVNLGASGMMSFIFFCDGWGSRGFLTIQTSSAFATLTQMTTTGTVLIMALHWMRLRMMMFGSSGSQRDLGTLLNHLHMVVYIVAAMCVFTDLGSFLYVWIFHEQIEDIWVPLLIVIALLQSGAAFFFFREARHFRSGISFVLENNAQLLGPADLSFITRLLNYMSMCSAFCMLSVVGSLSCALPSYRQDVVVWNLISAVAVVARLGTAFATIRGSFLNTNSRKQDRMTVHPVATNSEKVTAPTTNH